MILFNSKSKLKFIDLFCGFWGFRIAAENACKDREINSKFVFASDIDYDAQRIYHANFDERPQCDITQIEDDQIPEHDILLAGFPYQPFNICSDLKQIVLEKNFLIQLL